MLATGYAADSFFISTTLALRSLRAVRAVRARSRCAASSSVTGGWLATALLVRAALARFSWMRRVRSSWRLQSDQRVLLRDGGAGVAGDLARLDAAAADLLPPRDVGAPQGVRSKAGEVEATVLLGRAVRADRPRRLLERLPDAGVPSRLREVLVLREDPIVRSLAFRGSRSSPCTAPSSRPASACACSWRSWARRYRPGSGVARSG